MIEDFDYPTQSRTLAPGEWLCVVTDGATEAMNPAREFFGVERLRAASPGWAPRRRPTRWWRACATTCARFAAGAEIADDITLLVLRWEGG